MANDTLNRTISPDYLSIDFNTFVERQIQILKNTEQFKDYNFEGSNIRLLMEWFGYLSELNTFYLNKIAKNVYDDTADIYENVHRIAKMKGFNPRGYISSLTDLTIRISLYDDENNQQFNLGEQLYIPAYKVFYSTDEDETKVEFVNTSPYLYTVPQDEDILVNGYVEFTIPITQGEVFTTTFKGKDIIDGKIVLPFYNFNHDATDLDDESSVVVSINDSPWYRVENFYNEISGLDENNLTDNVYMLTYDKYRRYVIEFSIFRNVPDTLDEITITLLKTLGTEGNVGSNTITSFNDEEYVVLNNTRNIEINNDCITIYNDIASSGGADPQDISEISEAGKAMMNSQERCVTKADFISYLKLRADVISANVWGEREINKRGDIREYNKIHVSCIPYSWNSRTISVSAEDWTVNNITAEVIKPIEYSDSFVENLKTYLEKRKFILTYEYFDLPELIHFMFRIGIRVKRLYNYADVAKVVRDKLEYYFLAKNRKFGEKISFMDINNYILDQSVVVPGKNWDLIKGIDNLIFRDIRIKKDVISQEKIDFYSLPLSGGYYYEDGVQYYTDSGYNVVINNESNIYPPNSENDYPQYTQNDFLYNIENKMKVILLGPNQFPILVSDLCIFEKEGN